MAAACEERAGVISKCAKVEKEVNRKRPLSIRGYDKRSSSNATTQRDEQEGQRSSELVAMWHLRAWDRLDVEHKRQSRVTGSVRKALPTPQEKQHDRGAHSNDNGRKSKQCGYEFHH